jgi:hypothetical protein
MKANQSPLERWEESGRDIELGLAILTDAGSKTLTPNIVNRLRRENPDAYLIGKLEYALSKLQPASEPKQQAQEPEQPTVQEQQVPPPAPKKKNQVKN